MAASETRTRSVARGLELYIRASRRLLPTLTAACAALFALRRLSDADTWWHLASGRWIAEHWAVPHTDTLSFTVPDHPWINLQWLFDLFIYGLHRAGGETLLVLASTLTYGLAILLLIRNLQLALGPLGSCALTLWVITVAWERFAVRPEMVSLLLLEIVIWLFATQRSRDGRKLWLLVPIMLLWVNTHALFVIGAFVILCHMAALGATHLAVVPAGWRTASAVSAATARRLWGAGAAALLITVANPYAIEGVWFPFKLLSRVNGSNPVFQSIGEFAPPFATLLPELIAGAYQLFFMFAVVVVALASGWAALAARRPARGATRTASTSVKGTVDKQQASPFDGAQDRLRDGPEKMGPPANEPFFEGSPPYQGGVRGGFAMARKQPPPSPLLGKEGVHPKEEEGRFDLGSLLVFCGLAYLSVLARRNMALFVFGTAPFVAQCLVILKGRLPLILQRTWSVATLALAVVMPALLLAAGWFVASNGFYRWDVDTQECGTGVLDINFPIRAAAFAKQLRLPPRLFNDLQSGGYLSWDRPVEGGVFIDGRLEVYEADFFSAYSASLADPSLWQREAERAGIRTVVLFHRWPNRHRLIRWLLKAPPWALVYFDDVAVVFVRRAGNEQLVEEAQRGFPAWNEATERRLLGPVSSWQWPVARMEALSSYAQLLNLMGRPAQAAKFYERLLELSPPLTSAIPIRVGLASYYASHGDLAAAHRHLERATRADPGNPQVLELRKRLGG